MYNVIFTMDADTPIPVVDILSVAPGNVGIPVNVTVLPGDTLNNATLTIVAPGTGSVGALASHQVTPNQATLEGVRTPVGNTVLCDFVLTPAEAAQLLESQLNLYDVHVFITRSGVSLDRVVMRGKISVMAAVSNVY